MSDEQIKEIQTLLFATGIRADIPGTEMMISVVELYKEKGLDITFQDVERLKNTINKKHNITPQGEDKKQ